MKTLKCYCEGHCPDNQLNGTCEPRPGGSCFASVEEVTDDDGKIELDLTYGCMPPEESGGLLQVDIF